MTAVAVTAEDLVVVLEEVERAARPSPAAVEAAGRLRDVVSPTFWSPPPLDVPLCDPGRVAEPRHRGGDTDQAAAYANWPRSGTQRLKVLQALLRAGGLGCTDEELETRLGMRRPSPGNRRGELVFGGWVRDSGRRRETRSGNPAIVWVVTEAGRARIAEEGLQ